MSGLTVKTRYGALKGTMQNGVRVWKGIPYAKPPVGEWRFKAPQETDAWEGVRESTQFGSICPQPEGILFQLERVEKSEDCLCLNVFAPQSSGENRPVMVWIHGGAFYLGAGSEPLYDGSHLAADGDVIVVTINYRLGPFGFLHLSSVNQSYSNNLGLLDQIAALKWVKENISSFGGDPDNITVFGESAGSMSIASLLAMPDAKGLFQKAIMQSGASETMPKEKAETAAETFLHILNIDPDHSEQLHDVSAKELLEAADELRDVMGENIFQLLFLPVVDRETLPLEPVTAVAQGAADDIKLLIGTNRDEGVLFFTPESELLPEQKKAEILREHVGGELAKTAAELYPGSLEGQINMMTDILFWRPAVAFAAGQSAHSPVWMYRFDWHSEHSPFHKAAHGLDIPFVFGNMAALDMITNTKASEETKQLSQHIQAAWLSFAHTGSPSTEAFSWPNYDKDTRKTLIFNTTILIEEDPDAEKRKKLKI
ncbi:carboxylesterase/lipase family protein [Bacillus sonorensis]|uniref:carboxylesterase/lipase family protein n=1 Tax=Bacillus sonorensis TaxID=119858 RepID=UPI00227E50DD|nr:carboxylesterase/lipase family protein [Bacillus sonorensis]MCZ0070703.1 carboxylesterase/lipase family protein [Bacillus sonorensis]MCZ0098220.1 carboxylesterase/lipase family protein [Bacillus sonorensis]MEC1519746.1 carboxylesterase/lipase family protein [Bacillus sonorensis]